MRHLELHAQKSTSHTILRQLSYRKILRRDRSQHHKVPSRIVRDADACDEVETVS